MGQKSTHPVLEEEISSTSSTRLAWSSADSNQISIVGLKSQKEFANFNGVKLQVSHSATNWTHVKEIANTGLLVSVNHNERYSANLEVFDVSRKEQVKKIYSFEEVSGLTGVGDVTYNPRRNILGAIPVRRKVAYHLYDFAAGKTGNIVKLIRKSKWHSQYRDENDFITSFDFNPNGEIVATMSTFGCCLLSDINTHNYIFSLEMGGYSYSRCRWSPNTDEPILFVKYRSNLLNILDVEKKALILKSPIQLEDGSTYWIDVCPKNGNLLAYGGTENKVMIFDKRNAKIVRTFDQIHTDYIYCVRWSPNGDMLATASRDQTVALLDFKTGKKLYTGKTSDGKWKDWPSSVCFI